MAKTGVECAGDALRPFLMHAFGGLYLDLDMQCYKPMDDSLSEFDIILQEEGTYGGDDQIVNSMVASVPDHPFWKGIIRSQIQVLFPLPTSIGCEMLLCLNLIDAFAALVMLHLAC